VTQVNGCAPTNYLRRGGSNNRYFEFELARPHCLANYFQDAVVNYAASGRPPLPGSAGVMLRRR